MNRSIFRILSVAMLALVMGFSVSCSDDEPPLPDNLAEFEASALGFEGTSTTVNVTLSRAEKTPTTLNIGLTPNKLTYGSEFTTTPEATANVIQLVIPAGETEASFVVTKANGIFLNGDESISFQITTADPVVIGTKSSLVLSFSAITSTGATLTLQGKTDASNYTNAVLVDLSANKQIAYNRKKWALGFYGGSQFRVVLNHAFQMLTTASAKTDINAVTAADAQASRLYNFNAFTPSEDASALTLVDAWDGDLSKTAIAEVSATDASNPVYFVVTGNGSLSDVSTWYKIRVLRKGTTGYTLQYAKVGATTFQSIDIEKDSQHNYTFVSLDNATDGVVEVEPIKTDWDIQWSYSTYLSSPAYNTPYWYQDFILLNYTAGAKAAEVVSADAAAATAAYTNFAAANISGLTFLSTRDAIGSKWRVTTGSGILRDRFYVVQDPRGNVYKLKFVSMGVGGDGGERGRPVIEYALVKAAE